MAHFEKDPFYFVPFTDANRATTPEIAGQWFQDKPEAPEVWEYKRVNGTTYRSDAAPEVIRILEGLRHDFQAANIGLRSTARRIVVEYGDTKTGECWNDPRDASQESGYVGRSTGQIKCPLLIHSVRSLGGGAISADSIFRIRTAQGKQILYAHPNFHYSFDPIVAQLEHDRGKLDQGKARFKISNGKTDLFLSEAERLHMQMNYPALMDHYKTERV